jgi:hypothetical protein
MDFAFCQDRLFLPTNFCFLGVANMGINDIHTGRRDNLQHIDPAAPYMRRPLFPAIRWGAVLAGVAVGISVQMVLTLLGVATGLSATDLAQGGGMGIGPLLWAGFSMLVSAFVGGYVAARMSGLKRRTDGVLHGAVSWAVTTILFAVLATSIGGTLVSSVFNNVSQLARAGASGGSDSPLTAIVRSQGGRMDADAMKRLQQLLSNGQRDEAIQLVSNSMGIGPDRAATVVDQALIFSGSPQNASPQAKAATENAMQKAGIAAWVVFIAVALALAIGIGGGALGAAGSRRVSWSGGVPPHS